jgi:glycosyltransferase involved in cell wall biosynthesis
MSSENNLGRMDFATKPDRGISAVCPVFNAEASLVELYHRLASSLSLLTGDFEIVFVNDQSSDKSGKVISNLAAQDPRVQGIDLMRNYGQHNALLCGIRAARYDIIVTLDDDLQHPPEEIAKLLERLEEGYDVVYGTPQKEQNGWARALASKAVRLALQSAVGYEVARNVSAFRAFRTQLREAFTGYHTSFVSIDVLLTWATTRFSAVTVRFDPRFIGSSNYTLSKLLGHAVDMTTGFSTKPLQLASLTGFIFTLFGIGVLLYVIGRYFFQGSVPGFPFLASIVAIFSGAQLFALGVVGEYLARMHFRLMNRPAYVVRRVTPKISQTH